MALSISSEAFSRFDRLSFVTRRPARAGLGGEHRSRRRSPSTDFVDFRPYSPGDDFRRIDWNVYGRLGSLQVKVTEAREQLDIVLVLDCSSSMACGSKKPDKLDFAAQLVAALGYIGMVRSDSVRIACLTDAPAAPGRRFGPFGRRARMPQLVSDLSRLVPAGLVDLNGGLKEIVGSGPTQPLVIVVSDLLALPGVSEGLDALRSMQADVVVLHVVNLEELQPSYSGELELVDAETGDVLEIGVSLETLAAYRARLTAWLADREAECAQRGIRYLRVRTDRPLELVVLDDLRRGGVLK
jgi:uncharacterized protein (DUF58 family)